MAKTVDKSGFWFIPHNPVSKVGIFPYLGSSISDECEPDKVYNVFRSGETLLASVPTWDNPPKPFINDHEMLGEGFTEVDDRPVQGVITNPQYEDGVLYADITVYSEKLKEAIENGKKELSLGYFCKFEKKPGVYEGQAYDYIQTNMVGNHIALVDAGRCGSDVKVFDQKCVMDSFDIVSKDEDLKKTEDLANINNEQETTETKDSAMAKYVLVSDVDAILKEAFQWGDGETDPKVKLIADLLDGKAVEGVVPTTDEDETKKEDEKAEDKCGKDESEEEKKTEDESEEEKKSEDEDEEEKKAEDASLSLLKKIADGIDELLKKSADEEKEDKAEDEDEEKKSEDEDEEKKSEDEDDDSKETGDGALFTFGQDKALDGEDPAIKAYLA